MRAPAQKRETDIVEEVYNIFNQCNLYRATTATHWEEVAQLIMPDFRNTFFRENYNFPGLKKTDRQVDASGMMANIKFAAICDSMITPFSSKWHNFEASDPYLMKNRAVRQWYETASHAVYTQRYMAPANFRKNNQKIFQMIGAFGNGPMFIDQLFDMHNRPARGLRYKALPLGEVYIRVNHQGQVDAFVRAFRMTARQAQQKWGEDMLPDDLYTACEKKSEALFDFFHCVYPNTEYDDHQLVGRGSKPFVSHYVACTGRRLMNDPDSGYFKFPLAFARYTEAPGEIYGRGAGMSVLPALKTLNAEKATYLKVGHRAADPVFLSSEDGINDFSWTPGAFNKGGISSDGKKLVDVLPAGEVQITKEMMDEERILIGDAFLTTIFQTLVENPQMTATQVIEVINQKGIFLAPTVGGMASDYLDPMIDRELDLCMQLGLIDPMPPLLREAKGEYKVVYTSPLFKAARAGEASGFLRTVESATTIAGQTGDSSILDSFAFDRALPEIARIQDVPLDWMATDEELLQKRQNRAKAQQVQQQIQALPAQAAMLKARAQVNAKGGGIPQQGQPTVGPQNTPQQ